MNVDLVYLKSRLWAVTPEIAELGLEVMNVATLRSLAAFHRQMAATEPGHEGPLAAASPASRREDSVAVVPVLGLLTQRGGVINSVRTQSVAVLAATVSQLSRDEGVSAIVLDVDSPGGEVFGVPEAAAAIRAARAAKPIVAVANSEAGSAAYYLASQATELVVTPSGLVGSIGVFAAHEDKSKALEQEGRKVTLISAGKYKTEGNPFEPLGDEARAARQVQVDRYYGMFVQDVARGRGVNMDRVRNGFGEGRMVGAKDAVEQGMADHVGTLQDGIRRAARLAAERRRGLSALARAQAARSACGESA
jgi:signal peptide peptidase SppA